MSLSLNVAFIVAVASQEKGGAVEGASGNGALSLWDWQIAVIGACTGLDIGLSNWSFE